MSPHASPSAGGVLRLIAAETQALSGPSEAASITGDDAAAYGTSAIMLRPSDVRPSHVQLTGVPASLLGHPSGVFTPDNAQDHNLTDGLGRAVDPGGMFGTPLSASGHLGRVGSAAYSTAWQPAEANETPSAGGSGSAGGSLSQQASAATGTSSSWNAGDDPTAGHPLEQASVTGAAPTTGDSTEAGRLGSSHPAALGSFGGFSPVMMSETAPLTVESLLLPNSTPAEQTPNGQVLNLPSQQRMTTRPSSGGLGSPVQQIGRVASVDMDSAFSSPPPTSTFRIRPTSSIAATDEEEQDDSPPMAPSKPCLTGSVQRTAGQVGDTVSSMRFNMGSV